MSIICSNLRRHVAHNHVTTASSAFAPVKSLHSSTFKAAYSSLAASSISLTKITTKMKSVSAIKLADTHCQTVFRRFSHSYSEDLELIRKHEDTIIQLLNVGHFVQAKEHAQECLRLKKALFKTEEHLDISHSLFQLGVIFQNLGDFKSADEFYEKSLNMKKKLYGMDLSFHLQTYGFLLRDQGDLKKAKTMFEDSLITIRGLYKTDQNIAVSKALHLLGVVENELNNVTQAAMHYRTAIEINEKIYPDGNPMCVAPLLELGTIRQNQGDLKEAQELYQKALNNIKKHPDPKNTWYVAIIIHSLGTVLQMKEKWSEANEKFEEALKIRREVYKIDHPEIIISMYHIAYCLNAQNDLKGAKAICLETLKIFNKIDGNIDKHYKNKLNVIYAGCTYILGNILHKQEKFSDAKAKYEEVLEIYTQRKLSEDRNLADCYYKLGTIEQRLGDTINAQKDFDKSFKIMGQFSKESDPELLK